MGGVRASEGTGATDGPGWDGRRPRRFSLAGLDRLGQSSLDFVRLQDYLTASHKAHSRAVSHRVSTFLLLMERAISGLPLSRLALIYSNSDHELAEG